MFRQTVTIYREEKYGTLNPNLVWNASPKMLRVCYYFA